MINYFKRGIKTVIERCCTINIDERYDFREDTFRDKIAVVTGGNGDIGSAITERIVAQGGRVVVTGRKPSETGQMGENERFIYWDISDLSDRKEKFQDCVRCFGRIDIWINCAGYISQNDLQGDFMHVTEEEWKKQMDINGKALYFLTQTAAEYFRDNKIPGHIVQILSIDGIRDTWQPYGISKRVAIRFTEGIAGILKPYGIKVMGVAPGG